MRMGAGTCIFYQTAMRRIFSALDRVQRSNLECLLRLLTRRLLCIQFDESFALHA